MWTSTWLVEDALPVQPVSVIGLFTVALSGIVTSVARHYLGRALEEAHGNKTKAATLVGLPSYQTLTNWMNRFGVKT